MERFIRGMNEQIIIDRLMERDLPDILEIVRHWVRRDGKVIEEEAAETMAVIRGGLNAGTGSRYLVARLKGESGKVLGVIVVAVDLMKYERAWAGLQDAVLVTDSEGAVILATEPVWRGQPLGAALEARDPPSAIQRAFQATTDWAQNPPDAYVRGEAVITAQGLEGGAVYALSAAIRDAVAAAGREGLVARNWYRSIGSMT